MNEDRLKKLIERPEVQQMILDDYDGAYSMGIALNAPNSKMAIRVRIEGNDTTHIPKQITLEGETIPILINPNFKAPVPLSHP
ncbi:MAG TPA: hypothetical protein VNS58_00955 [Puia sp.]|nr:hypothetical protein [Puia sp.]